MNNNNKNNNIKPTYSISQVKAWIREVDEMKDESKKISVHEEEKLAKLVGDRWIDGLWVVWWVYV